MKHNGVFPFYHCGVSALSPLYTTFLYSFKDATPETPFPEARKHISFAVVVSLLTECYVLGGKLAMFVVVLWHLL